MKILLFRTFGSAAAYSCEIGYRLEPSTALIRRCQATGSWSGIAPRCRCIYTKYLLVQKTKPKFVIIFQYSIAVFILRLRMRSCRMKAKFCMARP